MGGRDDKYSFWGIFTGNAEDRFLLEKEKIMSRYWVMAPVASKPEDRFDKVWQFDLAKGYISIGWSKLDDITSMSREELSAAVAEKYSDNSDRSQSISVGILSSFYYEIKPGDWIIARRGRKVIMAVGKVLESAKYAPNLNSAIGHKGFLKVEWQMSPRDIDFGEIIFSMRTIAEISEEKFQTLTNYSGMLSVPFDTPEAFSASKEKTEFVLERYLEDFIVTNFGAIFAGRLKIYEDENGSEGQQYDTDIGRIDILAFEPESNSFVVIELKKGRSSDKVVGQILRYMGWVEENLCQPEQQVKGLIVCQKPDDKLKYALKRVNDIDIRYYEVSFNLKETP